MKAGFLGTFLFALLNVYTSCGQQNPNKLTQNSKSPFSIGIIADCQYCNVVGTGVRKYTKSKEKLAHCVAHFNTLDLSYTIHLGDFIDRDWESFDVVSPIYKKLQAPRYHVLGNHDFSVADEKKAVVYSKMEMPSPYYDFDVNGWRFIVLNGNDVSFHAYPTDSKEFKFATAYYEQNKLSSPKWNGAVGEKQLGWLKETLEKASKKKEQVIVYCHFPVYPENIHNLWNADQVIALMEQYNCVKGYINGHNHEGNYGIKNGIHYLTFKGMVDTDETSYGMLKIYADRMEVKGYGREENRILRIRK